MPIKYRTDDSGMGLIGTALKSALIIRLEALQSRFDYPEKIKIDPRIPASIKKTTVSALSLSINAQIDAIAKAIGAAGKLIDVIFRGCRRVA